MNLFLDMVDMNALSSLLTGASCCVLARYGGEQVRYLSRNLSAAFTRSLAVIDHSCAYTLVVPLLVAHAPTYQGHVF